MQTVPDVSTREESVSGDAPTPTPCYVARPAGLPRYGVVVIHELYGRRPEIDRACVRIAAHGCVVVAPDLMAEGPSCLYDMFHAIRTGEATTSVLRTRDARRWLERETGLDASRVGLLGFCLGGGFVLAAGHGFGAISTNYGNVPKPSILAGLGPVIGCYGKRDRIFSSNAAVLAERLTALGTRHEVHVFDDAGHSFLTDKDHGLMRFLMPLMSLGGTDEAREAGWRAIFAFFDRELDAPSAAYGGDRLM